MSIVAFRPRMSSTVAAIRTMRTGRRPSSTSTVTAPPGATPRISASAAVTTRPSGGIWTRSSERVTSRRSSPAGSTPMISTRRER